MTEDNNASKKIDEVIEKHVLLDDVCKEIYLTLMAYRRLRHNELLRALNKFDVKITKPTLKEHLSHLIDQKLIERNEDGLQNVSYSLTKEIDSLMNVPKEELKRWIEDFDRNENLPDRLKPLKLTREELYRRFSSEQIDKMVINDLSDIFCRNLFELKTFIEYDLKVDKFQGTQDFWNFVGNPLYRNSEKLVAEKCRASDEYKRLLFEKIELLIEELRSDKELLRKRREAGKRVRA